MNPRRSEEHGEIEAVVHDEHLLGFTGELRESPSQRESFTDVELEALLGRPARQLITAADRRAFRGRRVLITGAGGSVGGALVRQIAACGPARLTLVDQSELHLFEIGRAMGESWPDVPCDTVLADVTRAALVHRTWRAAAPDVVFHAAGFVLPPAARAGPSSRRSPRTVRTLGSSLKRRVTRSPTSISRGSANFRVRMIASGSRRSRSKSRPVGCSPSR